MCLFCWKINEEATTKQCFIIGCRKKEWRQHMPPQPPFWLDFSHRTMWRFCWNWSVFMAVAHRRSCTLNDRVWPISRISFKFRMAIFALLSLSVSVSLTLSCGAGARWCLCSLLVHTLLSHFIFISGRGPHGTMGHPPTPCEVKGIEKYLAHATPTLSLTTPGHKTFAIHDVWVSIHTLNCENLHHHWLLPKLCLFLFIYFLSVLLAESQCPE